MDSQQPPAVSSFFVPAFLLTIIGWGGLAYLVSSTLPTVGPRWLFFFFGFLAVTGLAIPLAAFLNRRFPSIPPATSAVVVREAIWFGIYGTTLAWLQIGRVLTSAMALLLALGLVLVEGLLRLRERSQWEP